MNWTNIDKNNPFASWMIRIFILVLILLFFYAYYRAGFVFQSGIYSIYQIISIIGIIFLALILRLRPKIHLNVVMVIASIVIGVYILEVVSIFILPDSIKIQSKKNDHVETAKKLKVIFDKRTKLEVVKSLRNQGVDAVVTSGVIKSYNPGGLLFLGGISNKKTVCCNESGKYMIYQSDRYGFNNPDSEWDNSSIEWFLTGDSFTNGAAVQPGEDISGQIRLITNESVVSVGMGGNGPLVELAALKEYSQSMHPKRVLWLYYEGNDLSKDILVEEKVPLLMKYLDNDFSQKLINRQAEIDSMLISNFEKKLKKQEQDKNKSSIQEQSLRYKTKWMRLHTLRSLINFNEIFSFINPLFIKILKKAKRITEEQGGKFYFVYLPQFERYNGLKADHDEFNNKEEVMDLVKNLGIPIIDMHKEVFSNHNDPLSLFPMRLNGHYNAEGYSSVAKKIVAVIKKYEQINN